MALAPRNISFIGKSEYMDSWKTRWLFPKMGMIPVDRSGGEKSRAALDAAERVFHAQGVSRASLAEVAKEAGVSRGAIYWHFENKIDLFQAMLERLRLPLEELARASESEDEPDPLGCMRELLIKALTRLACEPQTHRTHDILRYKCEYTGELLGLLTAWGLPESHPPEQRVPLHPMTLARDYAGMLSNRRFRLLTLAGTANFGALFLYIASAPAFVMDLLGLGEQDFVWFFAPTIGGMMLGAFVSGRAAGRIPGKQLVEWGFLCCGLAAVYNIAYNALVSAPSLPWAVLPTAMGAFGIALVFPIVTLSILDMYPRQRGSASSMQAFVGLMSNAAIAGLLSPLVSHDGLLLAVVSAGFVVVAFGTWRWYVAHERRYGT